MVVRSMATSATDTQGFAVQAGKSLQVEYTFDIAKIVADAKAHLDDFEVNNTRFGKFQFSQKKHQIDPAHLVVVAFVQDETSNKVLQAIFVPVRPSGAPTN
jgi:hypothetical protein